MLTAENTKDPLLKVKTDLAAWVQDPRFLTYSCEFRLGYTEAVLAIPVSIDLDPIDVLSRLAKNIAESTETQNYYENAFTQGYKEALDDALYQLCDEDEAQFNEIYAKDSVLV